MYWYVFSSLCSVKAIAGLLAFNSKTLDNTSIAFADGLYWLDQVQTAHFVLWYILCCAASAYHYTVCNLVTFSDQNIPENMTLFS